MSEAEIKQIGETLERIRKGGKEHGVKSGA